MSVTSRRILFASLSLVTAAVAIPTAPAVADIESYTIEEVQACSGDAMRFCQDALPDLNRIEACMEAKKAQLSKACQAMFGPKHTR